MSFQRVMLATAPLYGIVLALSCAKDPENPSEFRADPKSVDADQGESFEVTVRRTSGPEDTGWYLTIRPPDFLKGPTELGGKLVDNYIDIDSIALTFTCDQVGSGTIELEMQPDGPLTAGAHYIQRVEVKCVAQGGTGGGGTGGTGGGGTGAGGTGAGGTGAGGTGGNALGYTIVEGSTVNDLGNNCFEHTEATATTLLFDTPHATPVTLHAVCDLIDDPGAALSAYGRLMAYTNPSDIFDSVSCLAERAPNATGEIAFLNSGTYLDFTSFTPAANADSNADFTCLFDSDGTGSMTSTVDGETPSLSTTGFTQFGGDRVALRMFRSLCCIDPW